MAVLFHQKRDVLSQQVSHVASFIQIVAMLVFISGTHGAPEILPLCQEEQTSLYFNGKICEGGKRIDIDVGTVALTWYGCSATQFEDVHIVYSVSVPGVSSNASHSLRNMTIPRFDENSKGKPWTLYSRAWNNYLTAESSQIPMTYLWEDTIVFEDNSTIVRRHECELYGIPNNSTGSTETSPPNTTGSSAETSPGSSTVSTTESSALTFYSVNKLFLLVAFIVLALTIEN